MGHHGQIMCRNNDIAKEERLIQWSPMTCRVEEQSGACLVSVSVELLEIVAMAHISSDDGLIQCLRTPDPVHAVTCCVNGKVSPGAAAST